MALSISAPAEASPAAAEDRHPAITELEEAATAMNQLALDARAVAARCNRLITLPPDEVIDEATLTRYAYLGEAQCEQVATLAEATARDLLDRAAEMAPQESSTAVEEGAAWD